MSYATPSEPTHSVAPAASAGATARNTMAIAAMVLGIVAALTFWTVVGGIVLGLLAVVLGAVARRRARTTQAGGAGQALAGIILGAIALVVSVAIIALGVSVLNSTKFKNYEDCVNHAKSDQARTACAKDYTR